MYSIRDFRYTVEEAQARLAQEGYALVEGSQTEARELDHDAALGGETVKLVMYVRVDDPHRPKPYKLLLMWFNDDEAYIMRRVARTERL